MSRDYILPRNTVSGVPVTPVPIVLLILGMAQVARSGVVLEVSGLSEGATMVLPRPALTTNLPVRAVPGVGAGEVAFALEGNGARLLQITSGPPFAITLSNLSAGNYFLEARTLGSPAEVGDLSFAIEVSSLQPENDSRANAFPIPGFDLAVHGTNVHATAEPGEPQHAQAGGGRSIWWRWHADSSRIVSLTTAGSSFDTVLGLYRLGLTNVSELVGVAANDDPGLSGPFSQVSFPARAGTTYWIAVDGAVQPDGSVATGRAELRLLSTSPPSVTVVSPTNGYSQAIWAVGSVTEIEASAIVSDQSGLPLSTVEYRLEGTEGTGIARSGSLAEPWRWPLGGLPAGDYVLTVTAANAAGLVGGAYAGFSILNAAPRFTWVGLTPTEFQYGIVGLKGSTYELQSAADARHWDRLALWTNFDGARRVTDTNVARFPARFFRVIAP